MTSPAQAAAKPSLEISHNAVQFLLKLPIPGPMYAWLLDPKNEVKIELTSAASDPFAVLKFKKPKTPENHMTIEKKLFEAIRKGTASVSGKKLVADGVCARINFLKGKVASSTVFGKKAGCFDFGDFGAVSVKKYAPSCEPPNLLTPPIKLALAEKLYQPVLGSGSNSVYHVCGIYQNGASSQIKVAARLLPSKLSVRAEWTPSPLSKAESELLVASGLEMHLTGDGGYASVHLECPGKVISTKCLGAILGSMASFFEPLTPLPNMKHFFEVTGWLL